MIQKPNFFYPTMASFLAKKVSANRSNTMYRTGSLDSDAVSGEPDIPFHSVVYIEETKQIYTHGAFFGNDSSRMWMLNFELDVESGCLMMSESDTNDSVDFEIDESGNLKVTFE